MEKYYLEQAIKLSMTEDPQTGDKPQEEAKPAAPEEKIDMKDVVTTDFMKGLVSDLQLDIDQDAMGDLMKEAGIGDKPKEEEEKKEEEDPNDAAKKKDGKPDDA